MRKNKKIVALLTLLMFAVVMVMPVAGNAAVPATTDLTAEVTGVAGTPATLVGETDTLDFTADFADPLTAGQSLYLVNTDISPAALVEEAAQNDTDMADTNGDGAYDQATWTNVAVPAAEAQDAATTYTIYVGQAGQTAVTADMVALDTYTVTVMGSGPVVTVDPTSETVNVGTADVTTDLEQTRGTPGTFTFLPERADTGTGFANTNAVAADVTTDALDQAVTATIDTSNLVAGDVVVYNVYEGSHTDYSTITVAAPVLATFTVTVQADPDVQPAPGPAPSASASVVEVKDDAVKVDDEVDVDIAFLDASGNPAGPRDFVIWAESNGTVTDALTSVVPGSENSDATKKEDGFWTVTAPAASVEKLVLKFGRAGDYKVYAALAAAGAEDAEEAAGPVNIENYKDVQRFAINNNNNVKVTAKATDVAKVEVDYDNTTVTPDDTLYYNFPDQTDKIVSDKEVVVDSNGIEKTEVTLTLYKDNNALVGAGVDVDLSTNSNNIAISKTTTETDLRSQVTFEITGDVDGEYKVYADVGTFEVTIPVNVQAQIATDIEKTKEPKAPLAANEQVGKEFRFRVLDANGSLLTGDLDGRQGITKATAPNYDYLNLETPSGSDVDEEAISIDQVTPGSGEYYVDFGNERVDAGDYTLTVALDNGRKVVYNFTVQAFGTAQELIIDYGTESVELGASLDEPDIYFLDENGVKKDASNYVDLGATGYALANLDTDGSLEVKADEKYLGSLITVYAVAEREGLTANAKLTVTGGDGYLDFDQNQGPIDTNNRVDFVIKDEAGNEIALGNDKRITSATAIVVSQTNPDAKVSANVARYSYADLYDSGNGVLNVTSDLVTDAEILVTIMTDQENVYSGTLNYSFGKDPEMVGRVVVMTIGSNDVVVNNDTVTIDAAPFVNDDWRTMVPFRALAESFGAQVDWDGDAQTVTATLDGVEVVMTVGEETYTVNGVEKTMDTAPVIQDDRTLVPVRFVAEAFGFDVLAIYDEVAGATASVLFTK